jgi:hypothetical protein
VVFLVAFFFIALFSLGLDLVAELPGFFIAAIRNSSCWVAAAARAPEPLLLARLLRIIEICYESIKRFVKNLERNFKCAELLIVLDLFVFKIPFRHKLC